MNVLKKLRLSLMLSAIATLLSRQEALGSPPDFEMFFDNVESIKTIVLPIETMGKPMYLSPLLAVEISELICDKSKVEKHSRDAIVDYEGIYTVMPTAKIFTYILPSSGVIVFSRSSGASRSEQFATSYRLPERWNEMIIKYRVWYADSTISRVYVARFSRITMDVIKHATVPSTSTPSKQ